jgi:hypothetical protein
LSHLLLAKSRGHHDAAGGVGAVSR